MFFLTPIWLLAIGPWAVVCAWMFLGRRPRVNVPFVQLWEGGIASQSRRRNVRMPPIGVLLALLGILLGLLAAGHPVVRRPGKRQARFTLILDRGITMSARVNGTYRYLEAAAAFSQSLSGAEDAAVVDLLPIPGVTQPNLSLGDCLEQVKHLLPTAVDTASQVRDALTAARLAGNDRIVLISDQVLDLPPEIIRISPRSPVEDVAIVKLSARVLPWAQLMIRVRNDSGLSKSELEIQTGGDTKRLSIDLPSRGAERDYFVDLTRPDTTVSAALKVVDEQPANDRAWLVREGSSPKIEVGIAVSPGLRRMIDVYTAHHPRTDDSSRIVVAGELSALPGNAEGVVVAPAGSAVPSGPMQVVDHPVNRHVDWAQFAAQPVSAGQAPPGWPPILSENGKTLVAVGPGPTRQMWVGFDIPGWNAKPDFVVFWSNVFDWLGGLKTEWVGHSLNEWTPEWQCGDVTGRMPGLYRRSDGALRAFNPPDVRFPAPPQGDWRGKLSDRIATATGTDQSAFLLIAALFCLCGATAVWNRRYASAARGPHAPRVA